MTNREITTLLNERAQEATKNIANNTIYFAHPTNYYEGSKLNIHGTKESELIELIEKQMPEYSVYNPNQTHNQENYSIWREHTNTGMNYYYNIILPLMSAGILLPFSDKKISAGAFSEIETFVNSNRPAYEITESGIITPIKKLDYSRKLSVPETRKRVNPSK